MTGSDRGGQTISGDEGNRDCFLKSGCGGMLPIIVSYESELRRCL